MLCNREKYYQSTIFVRVYLNINAFIKLQNKTKLNENSYSYISSNLQLGTMRSKNIQPFVIFFLAEPKFLRYVCHVN